jgi:zinc protease
VRIFKLFAGTFAAAASLAGAQPSAVTAPPPAPATGTGAASVAVPADPAVRRGVLPNGMRYEIMRNATPPHNAALRLRFDVGSLAEQEDERGIAHFIEHMAMVATRNVPEGEMVKRLERAGLRFGPDTNAFTDFRQTWYSLNLPETDPATIATALSLLREAAGEATFPAAAVERERGVILAEERDRSTPASISRDEEIRFLMRGDRMAERFIIGLPAIIRTISRERLVRFYDAYYRPERALLVAVGDFDPAKMEADIRRLFSTWRGRGPAGKDPPPPVVPKREPEAHLFVDPALPLQVTLAWMRPADLSPDTRAARFERIREALGLAVLQRRIGRISAEGPLFSASLGFAGLSRRGEALLLSGMARPGQWKEAMLRLAAEQQAAMKADVTQAEIDRDVPGLRTTLSAAVAGAETRDSAALAQQLLVAAADGRVFTTPAERLAEVDEVVKTLKPEQVTQAMRRWFENGGPLIYVTSPTRIEGGDAAILTAFRTAPKPMPTVQPGSASVRRPISPWPYTDFGKPGAIAERREIPAAAATAVRFENGVRLTVKKTAFAKDEVLVAVRIGRGRLELTPEQAPTAFALTVGAFIEGGLEKTTANGLREQLSGRVYTTSFTVADDGFGLAGRTRPADLQVQLQVLAAYASDAALRPGPWGRLGELAATLHGQLESSPTGVYGRDVPALLHDGDARWRIPGRQTMQWLTPRDARPIIAGMRRDPLEVVVVGDLDVEETIKAVAATFGALPNREAQPAAAGPEPRFPAPARVRLTHKGRADQAVALVAWPTAGLYADQKRARALNVLAQVFRLRLLEEIRDRLGISYSPTAAHAASESVRSYGYLSAAVEAPPEKLDTLFAAADRIAASLRTRPVTADELERARRPLVENLRRERNGNAYWLGRLLGVQTRPEVLDAITRVIPDYEALTPADLVAAAQAFLRPETAWRVEIVPEPKS